MLKLLYVACQAVIKRLIFNVCLVRASETQKGEREMWVEEKGREKKAACSFIKIKGFSTATAILTCTHTRTHTHCNLCSVSNFPSYAATAAATQRLQLYGRNLSVKDSGLLIRPYIICSSCTHCSLSLCPPSSCSTSQTIDSSAA